MIELLHIDCMTYMAGLPDKAFELAIVDPPYGIGADDNSLFGVKTQKSGSARKAYDKKDWDDSIPPPEYFTELFRVSKNQIIWGANYFIDKLIVGKKWIVWDKMLDQDQSHFELAWTSFVGAERIFRYSRSKLQGFQNPLRFHPTEKPVALYKWLLHNYAKPGDRILDTHGGSRSLAIACHDYGFDHVSCELDADYHRDSVKRFNNHIMQGRLL